MIDRYTHARATNMSSFDLLIAERLRMKTALKHMTEGDQIDAMRMRDLQVVSHLMKLSKQ